MTLASGLGLKHALEKIHSTDGRWFIGGGTFLKSIFFWYLTIPSYEVLNG